MSTNDNLSKMLLKDWLEPATKKLTDSNIESARLDCLLLLEDELKMDRTSILVHPEVTIGDASIRVLNKNLARRASHEPMAYIRGFCEFYGRKFIVNEHTLVPRPESESIINLLLKLYKESPCRIIDIGTGSGCLAITAFLELKKAEVIATDIDNECIKVAKQNAKLLDAKVNFYQTNLLNSLPPTTNYQLPATILANLPYVPKNHPINVAAEHEPQLAIFGSDDDGLGLYRNLFQQVKTDSSKPENIITESMATQHQALETTAKEHGYKLLETEILAQSFTLEH